MLPVVKPAVRCLASSSSSPLQIVGVSHCASASRSARLKSVMAGLPSDGVPGKHVLRAVEGIELRAHGGNGLLGDRLRRSSRRRGARCARGRFCEKRKISFARTPKIWPLTSAAASLARYTASGAIFEVSMLFSFSTRAFCSGVSAGMVPIMRLQAKGAMQFERTLYFAMSSAIDLDSPTMPSLAAE